MQRFLRTEIFPRVSTSLDSRNWPSRFPSRGQKVEGHDEKRQFTPMTVESSYPSSDQENPNQVHILESWLLPFAHDPRTSLECELLYRYLMDNSASPLRHALEKAPFSSAASPLCMLDDSGRELRFSVGIVTDDAAHAGDLETLIFDTLQQEAKA